MKIQQRDNRNSVAGKSETNAHDYLIEAQDNYEQNSSSAVANQSLILGYSSATPHNHAQHYLPEAHNNYEQNLSSAVANQLLTLGYSSVTPDNYQQNSSSAVINQSFILGYSSAWLKARHKMFVLYLGMVSLIKYIRYINIQMECEEPFYEEVLCLLYMMLFLFRNTLIGCFA